MISSLLGAAFVPCCACAASAKVMTKAKPMTRGTFRNDDGEAAFITTLMVGSRPIEPREPQTCAHLKIGNWREDFRRQALEGPKEEVERPKAGSAKEYDL